MSAPRADPVLRSPGIGVELTPAREYGDSSGYGIERPHLKDQLRPLYRHWWIAIVVFLLVVSTAAIYSFRATKVYEAGVKLLIEPENPNVVNFKEVIEQDTAKLDYYETQQGILRSRTLARRTLDALNLWDRPEFESGVRGAAAEA